MERQLLLKIATELLFLYLGDVKDAKDNSALDAFDIAAAYVGAMQDLFPELGRLLSCYVLLLATNDPIRQSVSQFLLQHSKQ